MSVGFANPTAKLNHNNLFSRIWLGLLELIPSLMLPVRNKYGSWIMMIGICFQHIVYMLPYWQQLMSDMGKPFAKGENHDFCTNHLYWHWISIWIFQARNFFLLTTEFLWKDLQDSFLFPVSRCGQSPQRRFLGSDDMQLNNTFSSKSIQGWQCFCIQPRCHKIYLHSKHPQFVPGSFDHFDTCFHCTKFCAKCTSLNCRLPFAKPVYGCFIYEN